ncbi:hypothetical protein SAMN05444162_2292 [Paenibacillaceae bacterium GAS479]|nr:hypothetical protein SAMN05444162_2292 [Paenibacillaceae bacterium GAS479]
MKLGLFSKCLSPSRESRFKNKSPQGVFSIPAGFLRYGIGGFQSEEETAGTVHKKMGADEYYGQIRRSQPDRSTPISAYISVREHPVDLQLFEESGAT